MDVRYINPFIVSCRKVFDVMVHIPVTLGKPYLRQRQVPHMAVSVLIGFGGGATGCVVLRLSSLAALALASGLMGAPCKQLDDDAIDALGEIANMIAGHAKKDLPGGLSTLSVPGVILGDHNVNYPSGVPIVVLPCITTAGDFLIEVAVQAAGNSSSPAGSSHASAAPPAINQAVTDIAAA